MRNAECGVRNGRAGFDARADYRRSLYDSAFRIPHSAFFAALILLIAPTPSGAQTLPPLPDTTGLGVHVLALARAPDNALWVGTYGQGIFVLRQGAGSWEQIKHSRDTTRRTSSFPFVHAFALGPDAEHCVRTGGHLDGIRHARAVRSPRRRVCQPRAGARSRYGESRLGGDRTGAVPARSHTQRMAR